MGNILSSNTMDIVNGLNPLVKAAIFDFGFQWVAFIVANAWKTEKFYDLVGSSTFLASTWLTLYWGKKNNGPYFMRQLVQNGCVTVWAARLGTFLFSRVLQSGEDRRFRRAKEDPMLFLKFWTIQGLWVWTTLLPTMILNMKQYDKEWNYRDYLGFAMFAVGFLVEATADHQKAVFRSNPLNKNKFVNTGLWSISRHPNYLGEILVWLGLFLPASNVMKGMDYCSAVSPLFVVFLLTKVSGIPLLERYADKKWGNLVEYQQYRSKTAKLIPFIWPCRYSMGNAVSLVKGYVDHHFFLKAAILDFAIQWLFVPITCYYETGTFFDLVGSSTFLYLSWVTLMWGKRGTGLPFSKRQIMQSFCVSVWATRLGTFLHSRRNKRNGRFEKAKQSHVVCFKFWTIQGIWVYCTLIPTFILNNNLVDKPLDYIDYIGFALWTFGFLIEAIADNQKRNFLDNTENRGKFITSGLWSISRHPNYAGEILLWFGLFLPAMNMMEGLDYMSVLSPLSVVYLLTNISGVPFLERRADQRWGSLVEYQIYKNKTAKLFPFLW